MTTQLSLDFETASDCQLTGQNSVGLHNYMTDLSTRALMLAWSWNNEDKIEHADLTNGDRIPPEVRDALLDPHVIKIGFNSQFERLACRFLLGIHTPVRGWRCTMALAYMRSFVGTLGEVGAQVGLPAHLCKDADGHRLIKMFSMPQKITKNQPHLWRDRETDPEDWQRFIDYNIQDVRTENLIWQKLLPYPLLDSEWELFEADQEINDAGLPIDKRFVQNAARMSTIRKAELVGMMSELTSLPNPNSTAQLIPWLQDRGYPFDDMRKLTVKKVLGDNKNSAERIITEDAEAVLKLRQQAARTSVKKYDSILRRIDEDDHRLRHCFQFAGAQRTNRWSGRGPQPQNLVSTPEALKDDYQRLVAVTEAIRNDDYGLVELLAEEPMAYFAGCVRSSFRAPDGYEFVVCDLSAIESAVIAWLSDCIRLLAVFHDGRDPYKDFGQDLFTVRYAEVTSLQRKLSKPAVLGCGFGLGGGKLYEGKRTGLWGYAEGMGTDITLEEAHRQVKVFRTVYEEIPAFWKAMDRCAETAIRGDRVATFKGKLKLQRRGRFVTMELPSGRCLYYDNPKMIPMTFAGKPIQKSAVIDGVLTKWEEPGEPYTVDKFTAMGVSQVTKKWGRTPYGGPKIVENAVQATARDILKAGVLRARAFGFTIVGTVHDEIITLQRKGDNYYTLDALRQCMTFREPWMGDLPLKAAGYVGELYRKD